MAQYIEKDALVAEVERLMNRYDSEYDEDSTEVKAAKGNVCHEILCTIDSLEVKEVDLEKEIQRQYNVHKNPDNSIAKDCVIMTKDGFEYFAKYFFELGLKTQKGK